MYNLEYYGFGLLCRVQQECNSHFREPRDFFSSSSCSSSEVFDSTILPSYSKKPLEGTILDFSRISNSDCPGWLREFDLVGRLLNGEFSGTVVDCIADACQRTGLVDTLYKISQWTPDRKRSALIMSGESGWIASSLGDYELQRAEWCGSLRELEKLQRRSGIKNILSDYMILVSDNQCQNLCQNFMDVARDRGLFKNYAKN